MSLNPVAKGSEGDIYLAGVCLANGYLHSQELTAERFLQTEKFGRIYKTGDVGYIDTDDNIADKIFVRIKFISLKRKRKYVRREIFPAKLRIKFAHFNIRNKRNRRRFAKRDQINRTFRKDSERIGIYFNFGLFVDTKIGSPYFLEEPIPGRILLM